MPDVLAPARGRAPAGPLAAPRDPARLHELKNTDLYALYKADVKSYMLVLQNINRELCRRLRRATDRVTQFAGEEADDVTQLGMKKLGR